MNLGSYVPGEKVWVVVCCHKFETGQEFASTVTGYYLKVGALFTSKVSLTFNLMDSETGIYYAEIDTIAFTEGVYMAVCEATVDTVLANTVFFFGVRKRYALYG